MRKPCENCPFRKDSMKGWLGGERSKEIVESETFVCHKTAKEDDKTSEEMKKRRQCAGHMILNSTDNEFVRLAKIMKIELELKGKDLVFDSKEDFVSHHKNYGNVKRD